MFDLPSIVGRLHPFIVAAPTSRCGTTLVQRLICSSDNAICYGEDYGTVIRQMTETATANIVYFNPRETEYAELLKSVLAGDVDQWIPSLVPPVPEYLEALLMGYYHFTEFHQHYSESIGRPVWGAKVPSWSAKDVLSFITLLPNCKIVYLHRHLADCLASAKARKFVQGQEAARAFCQSWVRNMGKITDVSRRPQVMAMAYEDIVADGEEFCHRLAAFLHIDGIDRAVLRAKRNTWAGAAADGHGGAQYVPPEPLAKQERRMVEKIGGPTLQLFYPG